MKTRSQKEEDVKEAKDRLAKSKTLLFADFARMSAEELRKLRREMRSAGAKFAVVKKRLLNVMFREEGIEMDARGFDGSVGTIFAEGAIDTVSGPLYRTLQGFGTDQATREEAVKRILGGYDLEAKNAIDAQTVMRIGTLPPREALLAQTLGMFVAPLRAFMYLLQQKSEQGVAQAPAPASAPDPAAETAPTAEADAPAAPAEPKAETQAEPQAEPPAESPAEDQTVETPDQK